MILGAHLATPHEPDWPTLRSRFRRGKFEGAKVMIPEGFSTHPQHVIDLINDGAKEIILRTEDNDYTPDRVRQDFVGRGFFDVVRSYPHIVFILEIGNEQNLGHGGQQPLDPWTGRFWQLKTRYELLEVNASNLLWIASMPTALDEVEIYMARTREDFASGQIGLSDYYDGIAAHVYGHFEVDDGGGGDWTRIFEFLLDATDVPIYITEFGINHPLDADEKGVRYLQWLSSLPDQVVSAYVYWLGDGDRHPSYQVDDELADALSRYNQTTHTIDDAVRQLQNWARSRDPSFRPTQF